MARLFLIAAIYGFLAAIFSSPLQAQTQTPAPTRPKPDLYTLYSQARETSRTDEWDVSVYLELQFAALELEERVFEACPAFKDAKPLHRLDSGLAACFKEHKELKTAFVALVNNVKSFFSTSLLVTSSDITADALALTPHPMLNQALIVLLAQTVTSPVTDRKERSDHWRLYFPAAMSYLRWSEGSRSVLEPHTVHLAGDPWYSRKTAQSFDPEILQEAKVFLGLMRVLSFNTSAAGPCSRWGYGANENLETLFGFLRSTLTNSHTGSAPDLAYRTQHASQENCKWDDGAYRSDRGDKLWAQGVQKLRALGTL